MSRADGTAHIDITVEVRSVSHLHSLIDRVRRISDVLDIRRTGSLGEAA